MAAKLPGRWKSVVALGGALSGALLAGGGIADAASAPAQAQGAEVVPASCGQTVTARQGDLVEVHPEVGRAQRYVVSGQPGTVQHIQPGIGQPFCDVAIQVAQPVMMVAPAPAYTVPVAPAAAPGAAVAPGTAPAPGAPLAAAAPAAPHAAAPGIAPTAKASKRSAATRAPSAAVSDVPLTAAAPGAAPGALPLTAPGAFTGAAPAATAPPADPAAQVLPASEASKLTPPANRDGLGVPVILALIAGAGVAAGGVRVAMTRRAAKEDAVRGAVPPRPEAPSELSLPEADLRAAHSLDAEPTGTVSPDEYPTEIHSPIPRSYVGRHSADESETATLSRV
ncbi:hypothetical protein LQ327_15190 [Actinomycetospora endophytica]|uniref:Uncharacterized protein n=1 Tax=Actinomycetospora endophytica TaxID=2291215 RepID=A0ABS8P8W5_9PSEU|nr:hypothetical protein [Actinomycetospora endophytica]MCD2194717.1 hypothetical protein [Actinomycetospora endophytica]